MLTIIQTYHSHAPSIFQVFLGFSFRMYDWITTSMKIHTKTCYTVNRGYNQPPVESCEGELWSWHPASRAFSYGTYALYREKALHESCQVLVEHAQRVAK